MEGYGRPRRRPDTLTIPAYGKQHRAALKVSGARPFMLYSLRHTFLTRFGASGCDVWTLMRIAGHSNIRMSERYVHPDNDQVIADGENEAANLRLSRYIPATVSLDGL